MTIKQWPFIVDMPIFKNKVEFQKIYVYIKIYNKIIIIIFVIFDYNKVWI